MDHTRITAPSQGLLLLGVLLLAPLLGACETTPERDAEMVDGGMITIPPKDLEPAAEFINRTHRLVAGQFIRVEMSAQLYESQLGLSRDVETIERTNSTLEDGTVMVSLKRIDNGQKTNIDPDRLPRLYFGTGLEARAYKEMRIYIRRKVDKDRPIYLSISVVSHDGDSKLWVGGRLEKEKPKIVIESSLFYDETFKHYKHRSAIY